MLDTHPNLTAAGFQSGTASTNGWDTVFGIRFSDVNRAIVNGGYSPDMYVYDAGTGIDREQIGGDFGTWALTGGSGHLLHMALPLDTMTLQFGTEPEIKRRAISVVIEVKLDAISAPALTADGLGNGAETVSFRLPSNMAPGDAILVMSLSYPALPEDVGAGFPAQPASGMDGLNPDLISTVFAKWLNVDGSLDAFKFTFCSVNLNSRAATGNLAWLDPTAVSYGIAPNRVDDDGIFGILCMTGGDAAPTHQDVSRNLLPEGAQAGFMISKRKFLEHMVMPGLGASFDDPQEEGKSWPGDYFQMTASGTQITNSEALTIKEFVVGEDTYEATLEPKNFQLTLEDTHLTMEIDRFRHSYWGFWYNVFHDIRLDTHLSLNEDGQTIELLPGSGELDGDGNDVGRMDHFATIEKTDEAKAVEWGILIAEVALLLVSFGFSIAGKMTATAGKTTQDVATQTTKVVVTEGTRGSMSSAGSAGSMVIREGARAGTKAADAGLRWYVSIVLSIMHGISSAALLENLIQALIDGSDAPKGAIPDIGVFASLVMEPIAWPAEAEFTVTSVQFNGGMQIGGTPTYAT